MREREAEKREEEMRKAMHAYMLPLPLTWYHAHNHFETLSGERARIEGAMHDGETERVRTPLTLSRIPFHELPHSLVSLLLVRASRYPLHSLFPVAKGMM